MMYWFHVLMSRTCNYLLYFLEQMSKRRSASEDRQFEWYEHAYGEPSANYFLERIVFAQFKSPETSEEALQYRR